MIDVKRQRLSRHHTVMLDCRGTQKEMRLDIKMNLQKMELLPTEIFIPP